MRATDPPKLMLESESGSVAMFALSLSPYMVLKEGGNPEWGS